jgi:NADPH:quinone reductase-like Zn-dependent oxidoreductase
MMRGLKVAASVAVSAECTELPTQMQALVAKNVLSRSGTVTTTSVPQLGDLHNKHSGLPDSCEVLVNVEYSSINPADHSSPGPYPQVMGSDLAGTVVAVEDSCKRLQVGDKVWADIGAVTSDGKENGAFAPIAIALESQLGTMPKNIAFEEAASLPKVALTGYKALTRYGGAPFSNDETVLILGGSGGTGSAGIQLAKALGAKEIITTCSASNADYVMGLGATRVIDYHTENWWEVLEAGSIDTIYDTHGGSGVGNNAMTILKSGGYYVSIVGALPTHTPSDKHANSFINSDDNLENVDLLEALRAHVEGDRLRMPSRKTYTLSNILDAFTESAAGHVDGKLVIQMPDITADGVTV